MQDSGIVKLGCQLSDDMSKLNRSYPHMQAFQHATALLNVPRLWVQHAQRADTSLVSLLLLLLHCCRYQIIPTVQASATCHC